MGFVRWLTLAGLLWRGAGHLTTVCTSTAPSQCAAGSLTFWFGTYHALSVGGSAPGKVIITTPTGEQEGAFTDLCLSQAARDGPCPREDLPANCPTSVLPSDAVVTC